jgi:hypothetical protein
MEANLENTLIISCDKKCEEILIQLSSQTNNYQLFKLESTLALLEREFQVFKEKLIRECNLSDDKISQRFLHNVITKNSKYIVENIMRFGSKPLKMRKVN